MTSASRPSLDPDVAARIGNLELRARQIVEGTISGMHRSPFHGYSIEFAQHREYVAGDDLRHLDWKVWAKADRLYVKQFEEETNLRATLLLDASESMDYGVGEKQKYAYACLLAAAVSYLLLRQSDAVGLFAFDTEIRAEAPHRSAQNHLHAILHAMQLAETTHKTDLERIFRTVAERDSKRGLMVILSDLFADRVSVMRGLKLLRQRGHDVVLFHIMHDDEISFLFEGTTRFEGLEDPVSLVCDPRSLRDDYVAAVDRFLAQLRRFCSQTGIDYRLVRTGDSIDAVLAAILHERARTTRV